ncbi:hypothetical protein [Roseimaritima ulvae]|uniref:Uncharacterized protein n=1 Tax=Roseimaritima ulvae TaxID=980254 RepID=A0A5B9QVM1_9BACT|nr:hypothetical protein [Roseimaritima ulvae]QEG41425.1 hypothetical protein UC8_34460 [Roseimaritima ulvae]
MIRKGLILADTPHEEQYEDVEDDVITTTPQAASSDAAAAPAELDHPTEMSQPTEFAPAEEMEQPTAVAQAEPLADAAVSAEADEVDEERDQFVNAFDNEATESQFDDTSEPFVGQWNRLISSTNWEKGHIISEWRGALIEAGAHPTEYSDEAWARRAGGVTAPHVGRLRRVYDRFGKEHETYPGLYWSHFLAALDWEDAPMWLEGAMRSGWSVSQLRDQRWQANGGAPEAKPNQAEVVEVDLDEDVIMPAQGGGNERKDYDDSSPDGVSAGPTFEGPDFGEEDDIAARGGSDPTGPNMASEAPGETEEPQPDLIQPFRNLPELPDDLNDAVEAFKLAILRHKATGWEAIKAEDVVRYLVGLRMLVEARAE